MKRLISYLKKVVHHTQVINNTLPVDKLQEAHRIHKHICRVCNEPVKVDISSLIADKVNPDELINSYYHLIDNAGYHYHLSCLVKN